MVEPGGARDRGDARGLLRHLRAAFVSYPYVLGIALDAFVVGAYLLRRHATFLIEQ